MNIAPKVYEEATKRGLDWKCTGGGFDFIYRVVENAGKKCELTLLSAGEGSDGASPKTLDATCEVSVAFHSTGYCSVGIGFPNVIAALDFMKANTWLYFLPDMYEAGKKEKQGLSS